MVAESLANQLEIRTVQAAHTVRGICILRYTVWSSVANSTVIYATLGRNYVSDEYRVCVRRYDTQSVLTRLHSGIGLPTDVDVLAVCVRHMPRSSVHWVSRNKNGNGLQIRTVKAETEY
jgi:hypothetical protein